MALREEERERLLKEARLAAENAYAPYSRFPVGAALLTEDGNLVRGCNVENASYGLSICAERNAVFAAVTEEGSGMRIRGMAVVAPRGAAPPCGACRQVLAEFGLDAVVIYNYDDRQTTRTVRELLPDAFQLTGPATATP